MSDTSILIVVEYEGVHNGKIYFEGASMEAEPEESLISIVDRIETDLQDIRVKLIRIKEGK